MVKQFGNGLLTCDDGSGEVADFVQLTPDRTLRLIHVKGADSHGARRGVAAAAYEVVISQAVENLEFADPAKLSERLRSASGRQTLRAACWRDGVRVPDRRELLTALANRDVMDRVEIVIVQPHVSEPTIGRLRADDQSKPSEDHLRLRLLEHMLQGAVVKVRSVCEDLIVIGARE